MDKLKMHTPDFTEESIARLAELFPHCVTEAHDDDGVLKRAIDFDQLRQELSGHIVEGPRERYHLDWPGKKESLLAANAPIAKTLRPCRAESVDFDTTQNLFIEGDNLDALKLLRETYLGKIKMIYIDPPYNRGNDYVYDDDFSEDTEEYFIRSNQIDDIGIRLITNVESNGRFHSDWLSMIYSRLKLARNLLREDGVIFISIDDIEVANLRKASDEVFGATNFVADIIWQKKFARSNDATYFSTMHDHILCYAKSAISAANPEGWQLNLLPRTEDSTEDYANPDDDPRGPWGSVVLSAKSGTPSLRYTITAPSGRECVPPEGRYWGVSKEKFLSLVKDNRIWFGKKGDGIPRLKTFLSEVQAGLRPNTIWFHHEVSHNQEARQSLKRLFDGKAVFDSPKPIDLLKRMVSLASSENDEIYLDFFAGSGTMGHALMSLNAEDGGTRRYICVQLPEPCAPESEALAAGYSIISDIAKERIRRAGKKIKDEAGLTAANLDIGFRVLKVDTSNMKDVYYSPDAVTQAMLPGHVDNVKEGRTPEDLLFQVLLDWGVDLTLPVTKESIGGKEVYFVDQNALAACFESGIDEAFVKLLAQRKPLRAVFRDAGYGTDSAKINVEQIFKLLSPNTEVKSI
jgi:adenine-specific DNA-methyltransferase